MSEPAAHESAAAQRVAENEARFRAANERISEAARRADLPRIPFVCECANLRCAAILRLSRDEYEVVRADGRRFLNAPGHEAAAMGWATVVDRHDEYVVVERVGEAAELVEALPREGDEGSRDG